MELNFILSPAVPYCRTSTSLLTLAQGATHLHSVHGLNRVEPALPPPLRQVLAHPRRLQLLQCVQVRPGEPLVLEARRRRETPGAVDLQDGADAVQRRVGNVLEVGMVEADGRGRGGIIVLFPVSSALSHTYDVLVYVDCP